MLLSFLSYFTIFTLFTIAFGVNAFIIRKDQEIPEGVSQKTRGYLLEQMSARGVSRRAQVELTTTTTTEPGSEGLTGTTPANNPAIVPESPVNSPVDELNPTSQDQSTFSVEKEQKYLEIKQFLTDLVTESISFFSFFSEPLIYPSMKTVATIINYRYLVEENAIKKSNEFETNNVINDDWIQNYLAMSVYSSMSVKQLEEEVINVYEFPPEFSKAHVAPFVNQILVKQLFAKLNTEPIGNEIELKEIFNLMQKKLDSVTGKFGLTEIILHTYIRNAIISLGYSNKIFLQSEMVNILNNEYYFVDYLDYLIEKEEIKGNNPTDAAFNFIFKAITKANITLYEKGDKQKMQSVLPEQLKSSIASVIKHERQENLRRAGRNWVYGVATSAAVTAIAAIGVYNLAH